MVHRTTELASAVISQATAADASSPRKQQFGFIADLQRGLYVNGASLCRSCFAENNKCPECGGKGWFSEPWDERGEPNDGK